jgi:hypothetical protein
MKTELGNGANASEKIHLTLSLSPLGRRGEGARSFGGQEGKIPCSSSLSSFASRRLFLQQLIFDDYAHEQSKS